MKKFLIIAFLFLIIPFPECDIDGDGTITVLDARKLVLLCTCPSCLSPIKIILKEDSYEQSEERVYI